ncbi:MAG: hypothetical protein AB8H03_06955 [Saprospiraceae bacterium]
MEDLTFQYPTWYILFCVILGLSVATLLYFRDKTFKETSDRLKWILGIIRFLSVTLISMLLLSPLLKSLITETKKPVIVLAQDQSESILADMDETQAQTYQQSFKDLSTKLSENYDVKEYAFGETVREGVDFQFKDKVSNISDFLKNMYDLYSNQNLGAVVLATDGIYNQGSNPIYAGTKLTAPIYSIALGDTTAKKDLILKRVFHNKIAYLGDKFSVQIDISAKNCVGNNTNLTISKIVDGASSRIKQIPISINKNDFFNTQEIILDANSSGVQRYRISVNSVAGEVTTVNNSKDIFIDVLDARQKILMVANSPHPDLTAIKQSISKNKNYEITTSYIYDLKVNVASYDFVIMHQLPSKTNDASALLATMNSKSIPRMYIVGSQTNLSKFSQVQPILDVSGDGRNTDDVQATISSVFGLFTISDEVKNELSTFAPLLAPFGDFKDNANTHVLLYQRIGKIDTKKPLLLFGEQNNIKTGVLAAEGIWKWRLFDFLQHENHDIFEEVLGKSIQYLTLKEDKRKFRVSLDKNIFNENEGINFDAELYNQSYELINDPDATLTITNSEGKDFNFTFSKSGKSYILRDKVFPVGNYKFRGTVNNAGEQLVYNGKFSVQPIQLESFETTADHGVLKLLSEKYGGSLIYPNNIASIGTTLTENPIKPVVYTTSKTRSVINLKWIFFTLLGLLILEWFIRRYFGAY